jgi:hypothetical protein
LFLACHPNYSASAVRNIDAEAGRLPSGDLALNYRLAGDMSRLLIAPITCAKRTDGLWQHTCFEAFLGASGTTAYLEFNFSPSRDWAAYAFSAYRQRDRSADPLVSPGIVIHQSRDHLTLEVLLASEALPNDMRNGVIQVGLSTVVEDIDRRLSYWALSHAQGGPKVGPDFHRRDTFVLELPPRQLLH